jgi:hypothetical protein
MNNFSKIVIAALAFGGSISSASAAGVITNITESGAGLGSFYFNNDEANRALYLTKTFDIVKTNVLTFNLEHSTGPGNPYTVAEAVTNNTGQNWTDFHYTIGEPDQGQGVVFTAHNSSTLSGFTLDQSSGPRTLDFTGFQAAGTTSDAASRSAPSIRVKATR